MWLWVRAFSAEGHKNMARGTISGEHPAVKNRLALVLGLTLVAGASPADARSAHGGRRQTGGAGRGHASRVTPRVAVQPFEGGASGAPLRSLVSRIVRGHGFRPVTTLPHYEGTGQYPTLAREHHLTALVTGDIEERGKWSSITFLVWSGKTGSVVRRWTASAPTASLSGAVGRGFWQHLGPAVLRSEAPWQPELDQAPTMRIDASEPRHDEPIAAR